MNIIRRLFSKTSIAFAKTLEEQVAKYSPGKKGSRRERIELSNLRSQNKLYLLDNEFNIFNDKVTKVLDLGYVPGNWSQVAKMQMSQVHQLTESTFNDKCHILGFDSLFAEPIPNVSTIQGNIYSKRSQSLIIEHFQDISLRELEQRKLIKSLRDHSATQQDTYYTSERLDEIINETQWNINLSNNYNNNICKDIDILNDKLLHLSLNEYSFKVSRDDIIKYLDYKPQVILSDLSTPSLQTKGFYVNTYSRPYISMNTLESMNKPIVDPQNAAFDLADGSLLLACKLLRSSGTFVLRLCRINPNDTQLELLELRLLKVFNDIKIWGNYNNRLSELFFVCRDKKNDNQFDIKNVF
ncbi:uncharacterized protein KQ657_000101 [Scheffersomyces spartinae]|uniref:rRNA methyltransferase 2, mitochondrial n=1 Tax=Scheffersomyces spartinae TaxID=45513 RepID=A0A9P7VE03_9ASCO|nr:uncharacterized protein KQ657_000101 [Scheffersomyces spartinae]KAG7196089.1 hypothetical protein KQ657_000101 [Scheffersomyces spartinae]